MSRRSSKIATIINHEYITKVKSKGFIIGTLLGPLIMVALIAIPIATTLLSFEDSAKNIAILDETGTIGPKVVKLDPGRYYLTDKPEDLLKKRTLAEEIDGYLLIPSDAVQTGELEVYTRGGGGIGYLTILDKQLSKIIRRERLVQAGADTNVINLVNKGVSISTIKITEEGTEKDFTAALAGIGYVLGFVIYILMFVYGSFVSRSVIEEKANRIIEIIASSAKPFDILLGKVVGIGLVGLTQVVFWVILSAVLLASAGYIVDLFVNIDPEAIKAGMPQASDSNLPANFEIPSISPWLGVGFIFYFISGYFIYSTLFAALGSAVDQESDAAQLQIPVTLPIIIPILLIGNIIANPDGTLAIVLSLIPFFTPILMMVRVAATDVPVWQIAASVVLLISTFLGCLWVAAKIYRVGILMTGKKPTFKDIYHWIKLAK